MVMEEERNMGLFKSVEEKERERKYKEIVGRLIVFPGSICEYQQLQGYDVEIINTPGNDKGVILSDGEIKNKKFRNHLAEQGIEAIVNATITYTAAPGGGIGSERHYGLPVRKKKEQ